MTDAISWYDARAEQLADRYETVPAERIHHWLKDLLPSKTGTVLDVGAGSGRDAAWLASQGYEVVAVEPSARMRSVARARHPLPSIQWIPDCLPKLKLTTKVGLSFDVILLSAVWMHVAPSYRTRAFRKLVTLLKPGGLLAVTLRHGPSRDLSGDSIPSRKMKSGNWPGITARSSRGRRFRGRPPGPVRRFSWTHLAIRLPDDGTGALPLLRHIILNDDKSSTYKLGLLRTLCRIADGAGGIARIRG